MLREKVDEYLDRELSAAECADLQAALARDPQGSKLLAQARGARKVRAAAYESYRPTAHEARALAEQVMAEAHTAPAGRIGFWIRRGAAVAAAIVIVAGTFMAGQNFPAGQPKDTSVAAETKTVFDVVYIDGTGAMQQTVFNSIEDRNEFVADLQQRGGIVMVADNLPPGHM